MSDYSLFGLRVRSERPLPELPPASGYEAPDVTVRFGTIDGGCREAGLHLLNEAMLFVAPNVGRYRISRGQEILVEPDADAPDRNVRLYLFGSAFGALVHQRGLLPLHANAVEIDGKAIAFIGEQGEGKSTLAAWFHDQGHRIVADDICVIEFRNEVPFALPGLPRLRLWEDALTDTGRSSERFERSFLGADDWNKFDVPVSLDQLSGGPLPLAGAYLLESGERFSAVPLRGLAAAQTVFEHTYRGAYIEAVNGHKTHWQAVIDLVRLVPILQLTRQRGLDLLQSQARMICDHARALIGGTEHD